ncbi:MAG: hypothetical protein ACLGIN_06530 [Candidatus Sericytochromatia bacterium]
MPKIYLQTEIRQEGAEPEVRPRLLLLETASPASEVASSLERIVKGFGEGADQPDGLAAIAAIPAAAHENNLKSLLPRDLAGLGIVPGEGPEGAVVLRVLRRPGVEGPAGQADVTGLSYEVRAD